MFLLPDGMILRPTSGGTPIVAFDFKARRLRSYAKRDATPIDDRTFLGQVAFRSYEIRNRAMLGGMLEAAGAKDSPMSLLDAETELGIEPGDQPRKITSKVEGDSTVYEADGRTIARCAFAAQPVPDALAHRLTNFLAWRCTLHPAVRRAIADKKLMPRRLESMMKEPAGSAVRTTVMRFESPGKTAPPVLAKASPAEADAALRAAMEAILGRKPTQKRVPAAELAEFAAKAMKDKKYLDAFLALIEIGWTDDSKLSREQVRACLTEGKDDPDLKTYLAAIQAKQASETRRLFESIPREGLTHGYALDVNIAATYHTEHKAKEGIEAYKKALSTQPWMVGPWKDLGDLMDPIGGGAWDCYDIARAICPTSRMLAGVAEMERRIVAAYPDFF